MGIIETETFINEDGDEMKKDKYANGMIVVQKENPSKPIESELTLAEQQEARETYIMAML